MEGDSRNPRVSLLKKYDIPIDHLSFEYVEACKDKKELERIVRILRSGEEGIYPDLIKTAENQLMRIAPDSRVLRVETPALTKESFSNDEWMKLKNELLSWEEEMTVMDKGLEFEKKRFDTIGNKNLPEVRKIVEPKKVKKMKNESDIKKIKVETNTKNERIKSGDYAAWDKFDVDKELLKIDLEDERKEEKNKRIKKDLEKQNKAMKEKKAEPVNIDTDSYSTVEQQALANQAKDRGNEYFKSGDYENALKYYSVSLKLYQTANAYNNRAMTYIKLKQYEDALKDCDEVLKREQNNVKALHRRATAYQNLNGTNNNEMALKDLLKIISLEPTNRVAQADLQTLKKKLNILDVGKKVRMMIEESGNNELKDILCRSTDKDSKSNYIDADNVDFRKLPLTYYGPSTSTFQCEPHSMTHRLLSGPTFSREVMCVCNGNANRQNPLCHNCGERLSRPKQKSKISIKPAVNQGKTENNASKNKENNSKSMTVHSNESKCLESIKGNGCGDSSVFPSLPSNNINNAKLVSIGEKVESNLDSINRSSDINKGNSKEIKHDDDTVMNNKSADTNIVSSTIADIIVQSGSSKENNAGIHENINESKEANKLDVLNGNIEKVDRNESDRSGLSIENADKNIKERKNMKNELCKDLENQEKEAKHLNIVKEKIRVPDGCEPNETNAQINDSLNKSLPTASSQNDSKSETKKSKSKKKKSKEPRQDGIRFRYSEPVKIVQAPKYLNPTRSEPKPEVDIPKEENTEESTEYGKFKNFVPSKKCVSTQSGVLKSATASYTSNMKEKEFKAPSQYYGASNVDQFSRLCEGNKENIMKNVNDSTIFKDNYSEDNTSISSSFEFIKSWESMKKSDETYEKRAEIIRLLRPEDLKKVIGNNLDSDMLKSLLECLEKHFLANDPKRVTSFLNELPRIPRFSIVNLFLNPSERKVIERLIADTEEKGFVLDEEVKNSLKMLF